MPKLPIISAKEAIKVFKSIGYEQVRQRGSHVRMRHPNPNRKPITIPMHKTLGWGLLRKLLRDAGITISEFNDML